MPKKLDYQIKDACLSEILSMSNLCAEYKAWALARRPGTSPEIVGWEKERARERERERERERLGERESLCL